MVAKSLSIFALYCTFQCLTLPSLAFQQPQSIGGLLPSPPFGVFLTPSRKIPKTSDAATSPARPKLMLALFALNEDNNEEDDDESLELVDFPKWVTSLGQWPLYPSNSNPSLESEYTDSDEEDESLSLPKDANYEEAFRLSSALPGPLASLLNVEALLVANGEKAMDESSNFELLRTVAENWGKPSPTTEDVLTASTKPISIFTNLGELVGWDRWMDAADTATSSSKNPISGILKDATSRLDYFVSEASTVISPSKLQDLVLRAGRALDLSDDDSLISMAEKLVRDQGLDVREAAKLVGELNSVLTVGFVEREGSNELEGEVLEEKPKPIFSLFRSAKLLSGSEYESVIQKGSEMASLSNVIYEDLRNTLTIGRGHSIVANGTTQDVVWMVTDSIDYKSSYQVDADDNTEPMFVRTITLRGFAATDDSVDRERLFNTVCTGNPEPLANGIYVHTGLMSIARKLYVELIEFIDSTSPSHKIVLTGHSLGGSLSIILLLMLVEERGVDFAKDKIVRVFTFGSPPVLVEGQNMYEKDKSEFKNLLNNEAVMSNAESAPANDLDDPYFCPILNKFGLSPDMVHGYSQPWDPAPRFFSRLDALYPLIGDLGPDGVTLYASGPPRSLRPITRAIIESWDGWEDFCKNARSSCNQNYTSVGIQYLLLPEPLRYVSDRLVSANVQVPLVDAVLKISSNELLPALDTAFHLDTFRISFIPTCIRSFIHHFSPAYDFPIADYAKKTDPKRIEEAQAAAGDDLKNSTAPKRGLIESFSVAP